jgi:hypothetical protein
MVRFINSHSDYDCAERDDRGTEASAPVCTPCTGPCHSLSANAMWSSYCATCPFRTKE